MGRLFFDFEDKDTWVMLMQGVISFIYLSTHGLEVLMSIMMLVVQAVEDLCLHKMAGNLYRRLQQECETHITAKLRALVGRSPDAVVFLSHVESCWQDHCDQMLVIRSIALYLDRTYVIQNSGVRSLWDMGLQLFRRHLSACPEVESKTVSGLLRLIEKER